MSSLLVVLTGNRQYRSEGLLAIFFLFNLIQIIQASNHEVGHQFVQQGISQQLGQQLGQQAIEQQSLQQSVQQGIELANQNESNRNDLNTTLHFIQSDNTSIRDIEINLNTYLEDSGQVIADLERRLLDARVAQIRQSLTLLKSLAMKQHKLIHSSPDEHPCLIEHSSKDQKQCNSHASTESQCNTQATSQSQQHRNTQASSQSQYDAQATSQSQAQCNTKVFSSSTMICHSMHVYAMNYANSYAVNSPSMRTSLFDSYFLPWMQTHTSQHISHVLQHNSLHPWHPQSHPQHPLLSVTEQQKRQIHDFHKGLIKMQQAMALNIARQLSVLPSDLKSQLTAEIFHQVIVDPMMPALDAHSIALLFGNQNNSSSSSSSNSTNALNSSLFTLFNWQEYLEQIGHFNDDDQDKKTSTKWKPYNYYHHHHSQEGHYKTSNLVPSNELKRAIIDYFVTLLSKNTEGEQADNKHKEHKEPANNERTEQAREHRQQANSENSERQECADTEQVIDAQVLNCSPSANLISLLSLNGNTAVAIEVIDSILKTHTSNPSLPVSKATLAVLEWLIPVLGQHPHRPHSLHNSHNSQNVKDHISYSILLLYAIPSKHGMLLALRNGLLRRPLKGMTSVELFLCTMLRHLIKVSNYERQLRSNRDDSHAAQHTKPIISHGRCFNIDDRNEQFHLADSPMEHLTHSPMEHLADSPMQHLTINQSDDDDYEDSIEGMSQVFHR